MKNFLFLASIFGLLTNLPVHAGNDLDDPCPNVYIKRAATRRELMELVHRYAPTSKAGRVLAMLEDFQRLNRENFKTNPRYFYGYRDHLREWRTETQTTNYTPALSKIPDLLVKDQEELNGTERSYGTFGLVQYDMFTLFNQLFGLATTDYGTSADMIDRDLQALDRPCEYTRVLEKVTYRNLLEVAQGHTSQEPEWAIVNKYKDRVSGKKEKESGHISRDDYAELGKAVVGLSSKLKTKFGSKIPGVHITDQTPASIWLERALEIIRMNAEDNQDA